MDVNTVYAGKGKAGVRRHTCKHKLQGKVISNIIQLIIIDDVDIINTYQGEDEEVK